MGSNIFLVANIFKTRSAGGLRRGTSNKTRGHQYTQTSNKMSEKNISEAGYKCVCLNARIIVNKKNELTIMVEDIDPHIIGINKSWANKDT